MPGPARFRELAPQHLGHIHLHDDLVVEVLARVEFEVGVRVAGEAVDAGVAAAAIGIDGPAERHGALARNMVERRLGEHLMKRDARELGRAHGAHEVAQLEPGRAGSPPGRCSVPGPATAFSHSNIYSNTRQDVTRRADRYWAICSSAAVAVIVTFASSALSESCFP